VIIVLVCAAILSCGAVGGVFVRLHFLERRAQTALAAGMEALTEGDYPAALRGIGTYLGRHSKDVQQLLNFAEARIHVESPNNRQYTDCISIYERVLAIQPDNEKAAQSLLDVYQRVNFDVESFELAKQILSRDPSNPNALKAEAVSFYRQGKLPDALQAALAYNQVKPDDLAGQVLTLQILSQTDGGGQRVRERADHLRKAEPQSARSLLLQSIACSVTGDSAGAVIWLKKALLHEPPDTATVMMLITQCDELAVNDDVTQSDAGELENQALDLLERQVDRMHDASLSAQLASRLWQLDRFEDVINYFPAGRTDDPPEVLAIRCLSFHSLGRDADAAQARYTLEQAVHDHSLAKLWDTVIGQLLVPGDNTNDGATIGACRQVLIDDPANPYFHFFLAEAYARLNESDSAMREWQLASNCAPSWPAPLIRIEQLMLDSGRIGDAIAVANRACRCAPLSRPAHLALIAAKTAELQPGDAAGADKLLTELETLPAGRGAGDGDVIPLLAEIQLRAGRNDVVKQIIRSAIAAQPPPTLSIFLRLADLSRQENLGLEQQCLRAATQIYGITPEVAFAQADALRRANRPLEGLESLRSARNTAISDRRADAVANSEKWDVASARYLDSIGDAGARQAWIDLANRHEKETNIQWMAMNAESVRGDRPFVGQLLDRLKQQLGDQDVMWRFARAKYLLEQSPDDDDRVEAALLLTELTREEPDFLDAHILLAHCRYEMHDTQRALEQLTDAADIAPKNADVALELVRMLEETGNFTESRKYTDRISQLSTLTAAQRRTTAVMMSNEGDWSGAVAMLESLVLFPVKNTDETDDPRLMLATLYFQTGQTDKLNAICGQLLQSAEPGAMGLVAELFAAAGRVSESDAILNRLDTVQTAPDVKQMILGKCAMRLGEFDRAAECYRQATVANPSNKPAWRALVQTELRRLDAPAALASARAAAEKFSDDPGFAAVARSLGDNAPLLPRWPEVATMESALLDASAPQLADEESAIHSVCQAIVQGNGNHSTAKQMATSLSGLADDYRQVASLQVLAGRLELATGDADRAAALATRAMQDFPSDPAPAALSARAWTAAGNWNEALQAAFEWRSRAPESRLEADQMIAHSQIQLNDLDDAARQLQPYVSSAEADPDRFGEVLLLVAVIQIKTNHSDQAADMLRPLLAKSTEARIDWIKLAAGIEPPAQAATWVSEVEPRIPAGAVAERLELAEEWQSLAERSNTEDYQQKAKEETEQFARQCAARASAAQLLVLGSLQEKQGDADGARTSYLAALQLDPNSLIGQNNLAMLLAKSRHLDEALIYAKKASQVDSPYQADCQETLAYVQDRLGQQDDAIKTLVSALKISPNHIPSLIELTGIYASVGQMNQARTVFQELEQLAPDPDFLTPELQAKFALLRQKFSQ